MEYSDYKRGIDEQLSQSSLPPVLPKLHVHLLKRLQDFAGADLNGFPSTIVRPQSRDSMTSVKKLEKNFAEQKKGGTVSIGNTQFQKDKVISIGDLDGNGLEDYIISNPTANNRTGTIRLYLMSENDQFLYSRELIPGKWGFQSPALKHGDEFGSSVFKLPFNGTESSCILAIGAPGGSSKNAREGKVYIVSLSNRGSVLSSRIISSDSEPSLSKQHETKEGFGSDIKAIGDLNGDGLFELSVKSLSGSTTMLFLDENAEVKTSLKIHAPTLGYSNPSEESSESVTTLSHPALQISAMRIRAGIVGQCFYNETNCACSLKPVQENSRTCLDVLGPEKETGKTVCKDRDCKSSYSCSCDGAEVCERVKRSTTSHSKDGPAPNGNYYCSLNSVDVEEAVVLVGVPLPTPEKLPDLAPFNATHCRCSKKKDIGGPGQCLQYFKTIRDVALLCTARPCILRENEYSCDGIGQAYCSRSFSESVTYFDDGKTDTAGVVYCHRDEHTIESLSRLY